MMAIEELATSEGTEHRVNTVVHYVVRTDWRQRVALYNTHTQHQQHRRLRRYGAGGCNVTMHTCKFLTKKIVGARKFNFLQNLHQNRRYGAQKSVFLEENLRTSK